MHNDLNPDNVMLDDDGTPVIIDFDICRKEGEICAPGDAWMGSSSSGKPTVHKRE